MQGNPMVAALMPLVGPMLKQGVGELTEQMRRIEIALDLNNQLLRGILTAIERREGGNGHSGDRG